MLLCHENLFYYDSADLELKHKFFATLRIRATGDSPGVVGYIAERRVKGSGLIKTSYFTFLRLP